VDHPRCEPFVRRRSECLSAASRPPQVGHLWAGVVMDLSMVRAEVPVHTGSDGPRTASKRVVSTGSDQVRIPPDGCRGPAALANNAGSLRDGPHLAVELVPTLPGSTNVVLVGRATPRHSQQSRPVPSGHARTMPRLPQPASFVPVAGDGPARTGFASRGSIGRGLHRPCRARPADRSLVAEDRSAGGVRARTEPEPPDAHEVARGGSKNVTVIVQPGAVVNINLW
jgi:hypothetical protein